MYLRYLASGQQGRAHSVARPKRGRGQPSRRSNACADALSHRIPNPGCRQPASASSYLCKNESGTRRQREPCVRLSVRGSRGAHYKSRAFPAHFPRSLVTPISWPERRAACQVCLGGPAVTCSPTGQAVLTLARNFTVPFQMPELRCNSKVFSLGTEIVEKNGSCPKSVISVRRAAASERSSDRWLQ